MDNKIKFKTAIIIILITIILNVNYVFALSLECENLIDWNLISCTTQLTSDSYESEYAIEVTNTDNVSAIYSDITSYINSGYYLITYYGNIETANTLEINIQCLNDVNVLGQYYNNSDWTRQGILIQPTDYDTATGILLKLVSTGIGGIYSFDAIQINEITQAEYIGINADNELMNNYKYESIETNGLLNSLIEFIGYDIELNNGNIRYFIGGSTFIVILIVFSIAGLIKILKES